MKNTQVEVAQMLLQINAIKVQPSNPFTWASGWKSPIYCDNRKILSFPFARNLVQERFVEIVGREYPGVEVIAGVATGAIAHGILVADKMNLPFIYVRTEPKNHGLENLIEGVLEPGQKVVVIEDLVSTGNSSLKAAEAVRRAGGEVLGMVAVFSYEFPQASENFRNASIPLSTLSCYQVLIGQALELGRISESEVGKLMEWRMDPAGWGK